MSDRRLIGDVGDGDDGPATINLTTELDTVSLTSELDVTTVLPPQLVLHNDTSAATPAVDLLGHVAVGAVLSALCLITVLGNTLVIHAVRTDRKLQTVSTAHCSAARQITPTFRPSVAPLLDICCVGEAGVLVELL